MVGIGLMIGPVIGQAVYSAVGFEKTFYYTAGMIAVPSILVILAVPNRLNKSAAEFENEKHLEIVENKELGKEVTFRMFLKNKRAMMASVSSIFAMIFMLFMNTSYSNYLLSVGVDKDYVGYIFALGCFVYSVCSPIVGLLCKCIPKIYMTQFAFIMSFFSLIL